MLFSYLDISTQLSHQRQVTKDSNWSTGDILKIIKYCTYYYIKAITSLRLFHVIQDDLILLHIAWNMIFLPTTCYAAKEISINAFSLKFPFLIKYLQQSIHLTPASNSQLL